MQSDGTYVLGTYDKSDGAVVARHSVSYSAPSVEVKMVEIDGDSRPDIVVSRQCNDTATGKSRWGLYRNLP